MIFMACFPDGDFDSWETRQPYPAGAFLLTLQKFHYTSAIQ
jgi:hypothetical protein